MLILKDQMQRELKFDSAPKRIISLVPSITELLHDLNLRNEVVGLTKFCIHPKNWCSTKTKIGGTKKIDFEKIKALNPDLIIANKEENTKEDIRVLEQSYPVLMTDVNSYPDALEMIRLLGKTCNRETEAKLLIEKLEQENAETDKKPLRSAIYLIWKNPYFAVGNNTFINDMMRYAGFKNLIELDRYPEITIDQINELKPEFLLLSTEPYPFKNNDLNNLSNQLKTTIPILVDGEMFSWYGSRLLKSFAYFKQLHQDLDKI